MPAFQHSSPMPPRGYARVQTVSAALGPSKSRNFLAAARCNPNSKLNVAKNSVRRSIAARKARAVSAIRSASKPSAIAALDSSGVKTVRSPSTLPLKCAFQSGIECQNSLVALVLSLVNVLPHTDRIVESACFLLDTVPLLQQIAASDPLSTHVLRNLDDLSRHARHLRAISDNTLLPHGLFLCFRELADRAELVLTSVLDAKSAAASSPRSIMAASLPSTPPPGPHDDSDDSAAPTSGVGVQDF